PPIAPAPQIRIGDAIVASRRLLLRPRALDLRARLLHADRPDRVHLVVGALVVAAVIAVADVFAHLRRRHRLHQVDADHRLGLRRRGGGGGGGWRPATRVHGKFSIHEAWLATLSNSWTLAIVFGAAHQLWNLMVVPGW